MSIFQKIFFKTNSTARDIKEVFNPLLVNKGYAVEMFFLKSERHIKYEKEGVEFDFWWVGGNRPTLFLKRDGSYLKTNIYETMLKKHGLPGVSIGKVSFFINSKLDKDKYYNDHSNFVSDYLNSI